MSRKIRWGFLGIVAMFSFLLAAPGQAGEGWKKAVTLPSGEVVCDLKGIWNYEFSALGELRISFVGGSIPDVIENNPRGYLF